MNRLLVLVLAMVMSGCASIPLGTMLEFRSFGKDEFLSIQPESFNFSVRGDLEALPSEVSEIRLSVFLKLTEEQGFVTLFNNARLAVQ